MSPLDAAVLIEGSAPALQLLPELGMNTEALRPAVELLIQSVQELGRQRSVHYLSGAAEPDRTLLSGDPSHARLECLLHIDQPLVGLGGLLVRLFLADQASP